MVGKIRSLSKEVGGYLGSGNYLSSFLIDKMDDIAVLARKNRMGHTRQRKNMLDLLRKVWDRQTGRNI